MQVGESWHSLTYELASALVKTLVHHVHDLESARKKLDQLKSADPDCTKPKTAKADSDYKKLLQAKRFFVMNKRTGVMATEDWVRRNIVADPETGEPTMKNPRSKASPWILALEYDGRTEDVELRLKVSSTAPSRPVRCWDIREASVCMGLEQLVPGYEHMLANEAADCEDGAENSGPEDEEDDASSDTQLGDDAGLYAYEDEVPPSYSLRATLLLC